MNTHHDFENIPDSRPEFYFLFHETDKDRKKFVDTENEKKEKKEKYIVCKECGNAITHERYKVKIKNYFQHTFLNPEGMVFEIGCFAEAGGCAGVGVPTRDWSWFQGFHWQTVLCVKCLAHLGWHYSHISKESFFGLILDALI